MIFVLVVVVDVVVVVVDVFVVVVVVFVVVFAGGDVDVVALFVNEPNKSVFVVMLWYCNYE